MQTQLIDGVAPLAIDDVIMATASKNARDGFAGSTRGIAILNADGVLYRIIGSQNPHETSDVVDALKALGLIDRVGFDDDNAIEIDSLTRKPIDTPLSAILQIGTIAYDLPKMPRITLKDF